MFIALSLGFIVSFFASGLITRPLKAAVQLAQRIGAGDLSSTIKVIGTDEISELLLALEHMQSDLNNRIEKEYRAARVNTAIRYALDNVAANVMMVNRNNEVRYFNNMLRRTLEQLPGIDPEAIINCDIRELAPDADAELAMNRFLTVYQSEEIEFGERVFEFRGNAVESSEGEILGTVIEWKERTFERRAEREIGAIVTAARAGDLSQRIEVDEKIGFFRSLAVGVNELIAVSEHSLVDIARVMGSLSHGDLTKKINNDYAGTFAEVKVGVNGTLDKLESIVQQIRSASELIRKECGGIARDNQEVAESTACQAEQLARSAERMKTMNQTVRQNAAQAREADELAAQARSQAEGGGDIVRDAVAAMTEISTSSQRIADIIGVIDDIAFQTNLLALNAVVEAARAGEQGKGFAVVAGEVRNLAQRSATAAREIKDLIDDSVSKVEGGARLVGDSGEALHEIVETSKQVSDIVSTIAAAGEDQAQGMEQVSTAVMAMDQSARESSTLVQEAARASQQRSGKAPNLAELVAYFTLREDAEHADGERAA